MLLFLLKTEIHVSDKVEVKEDMSAYRHVVPGLGVVVHRRYDMDRRSAKLSVRIYDDRVQKMWPTGLRLLGAENDVPPPRLCRQGGLPQMTISASAGPRVLRLGTLLLEGVSKQFQHVNFCGGARYRIEN